MKNLKLIILDRDGVINQDSIDYIKSPKEWIPIPGSLEAIAKLHQAGFTVVVATNQSGIGRKLFSLQTLDQIHQKMLDRVKTAGGLIDKVFYCPHTPNDNCLCRKPKPGLFQQISEHYAINFHTQFVPAIGDSLRDLEAAENAGAHPILVETGNGITTRDQLPKKFRHIPCFKNLMSSIDTLINTSAYWHK